MLQFYYVYSLHDDGETMVCTEKGELTEKYEIAVLFNAPCSNRYPLGQLFATILNYTLDYMTVPKQLLSMLSLSFKEIPVDSPDTIPLDFLMTYLNSIPDDEELEKLERQKLYSYIQFIKLCSYQSDLCTMKNLSTFTTRVLEPLKGCNRLHWEKDFESSTIPLEENEIQSLFSSSNEDVNIDLHYYPVNSIFDLFSATLQEAFAQKRVVRKCSRCKRYFITENKMDMRYCRLPNFENKTCAELADLKRRRQRYSGRTLVEKTYKSIYTMLNRFRNEGSIMNDVFEEFVQTNEDFIKKKGKRIATEREYLVWLCSYYKKEKTRKKILEEFDSSL